MNFLLTVKYQLYFYISTNIKLKNCCILIGHIHEHVRHFPSFKWLCYIILYRAFIEGHAPGKLTSYNDDFSYLLDYLEGSFSYNEVQFKRFCQPVKTMGSRSLEPKVQPMLYWFSSVKEQEHTPNWLMLVLYPAFCGCRKCHQLIHICTLLSVPYGHQPRPLCCQNANHKYPYALEFPVKRSPPCPQNYKLNAICGLTPN